MWVLACTHIRSNILFYSVGHSTHMQGTYFSQEPQTIQSLRGYMIFFPLSIPLPQVERREMWVQLLKIQSNSAAGATAEVKQPESCRQSFNLKRTRSPWGARGAERIKKFNNSMFYGLQKWDLSTGVGRGRWEITAWSVHINTNSWTRIKKKKKEVNHFCNITMQPQQASKQCREEDRKSFFPFNLSA